MTKEQIIQLIKTEEECLYFEFTELRELHGRSADCTLYAAAQWNAVLGILEKIEKNEENENA